MEMRGPLPAFLSRSSRERDVLSAVASERATHVPKRRTRPAAKNKTSSRDNIEECSVVMAERSDTEKNLARTVESLKARLRVMERQKEFEMTVMEEFRLEARREAFTERRVLFLKAQLLCMERQIERLERALPRGQTLPSEETIPVKSMILESESVIASAVEALQDAHTAVLDNRKDDMENLCEVLREACYHLLRTWRNIKPEREVEDFPLSMRKPEGCCKECRKRIEEWMKAYMTACDLRISQMRSENHIRNFSGYGMRVLLS